MASSQISSPGTTFGPCETQCKHTDCEATREMALSVCRLCEKPIGYETQFYSDPMNRGGFVHAECLEELSEVMRTRGGVICAE